MCPEPHLLYEKKEHIAYITFNRVGVMNALDPEIMVRLRDTWLDFDADDDMRVAIVTGAGDKAFTSGADLARLITLISGARSPQDTWDHTFLRDRADINRVALLRGYNVFKPIIAAINGYCLAGGTELIQAFDIRIASQHATFGLFEATRGLIPFGGSHIRLPRQIPFCKAMELMLVGAPMTAQEAYRIGLINYVVPKADLMSAAEQLARKIARNGPLAVRKIKETVLRGLSVPLDQAYGIEDESMAIVMKSEDAREGSLAFVEKREPHYTGR